MPIFLPWRFFFAMKLNVYINGDLYHEQDIDENSIPPIGFTFTNIQGKDYKVTRVVLSKDCADVELEAK